MYQDRAKHLKTFSFEGDQKPKDDHREKVENFKKMSIYDMYLQAKTLN